MYICIQTQIYDDDCSIFTDDCHLLIIQHHLWLCPFRWHFSLAAVLQTLKQRWQTNGVLIADIILYLSCHFNILWFFRLCSKKAHPVLSIILYSNLFYSNVLIASFSQVRILIFSYVRIFSLSLWWMLVICCPVGLGSRIYRLQLCSGVRPPPKQVLCGSVSWGCGIH